PGRGHPRLDRGSAVEPHPPGRRGRGPRGPSLRPRPGALGRVAGRGVRPGRQHPHEPPHGRRGPPRSGGLLDRHPRQLEGRPGRRRRVIGIDASATVPETRAQIERIARRTASMIGLERDLRADELELDDRYHGGIYGIPDAATLEAMRLVARLEGMITDPVYEG